MSNKEMTKAANKAVGEKNHDKINAFQLAMLTVAFVAGIRSLPAIAMYGFTCVFYYIVAAVMFLIPSALVSAELATAWPGRGGIYVWVREALGGPWDFIAIWLQFLSNVVYFPAFLSFVGASASYIFMPELAHNKFFMISFILVIFWGVTFVSFFGTKASSWCSSMGVFTGTFIPLLAIVILAAIWLFTGGHSQITFSVKSLFPDFSKMHVRDLVFLTGLIFSFTGMEASGAHAKDVKNVQRDYPRAILLALPFIMAVGLGALAIAVVIPVKQLSIVAGNMQAFRIFLARFHLTWGVPVLAFLVAFGSLGNMISSIIGPSKGLFGAAIGGEIPPLLSKANKHNMPTNMLILQGVVVSIFSMMLLFMPSVSSAYWLMIATVSIIYLGMYFLMFLSVIVLRYKKPDVPRAYKLPGGKVGLWVISGVGILTTLGTMVISFFPPAQIKVGSVLTYELSIIAGIIVLVGAGLVIYAFRNPKWIVTHEL